MRLTSKQRQLFCEALIDVFPSRLELAKFVRTALGVELAHVVQAESLRDAIHRLVLWVEASEHSVALLAAAFNAAPNNKILQVLVKELHIKTLAEKQSSGVVEPKGTYGPALKANADDLTNEQLEAKSGIVYPAITKNSTAKTEDHHYIVNRQHIIDLLDRLETAQLDRLMFLIYMPLDLQPSVQASSRCRKDGVLRWAAAVPERMQKLEAELKYLIEKEQDT